MRARRRLGASGLLARTFLDSKLTPLFVVGSLLLGVFSVLVTPREEEPQIRVPMVDVFAAMPGATAREIERRVVSPIEKALHEIPNAEYVYSTSQPSGGLVIVRFVVGTDPDQAVARVQAKLAEVAPSLPSGVPPPVVVPRSIDDVPVAAWTISSTEASPLALRRVAEEVKVRLARHPRVAQVRLLGGARRVVSVTFDRERLAAHGLSLLQAHQALGSLNVRLPAGSFSSGDVETRVDVGALFSGADDVAAALVGSSHGRPVAVRDVATVHDGADEPSEYVWMTRAGWDAPAVTIAVSKKPGTNAVDLVKDLDATLDSLRGPVVPSNVDVTKTRDYGHTASEKSSELMLHVGLATVSVVFLMALFLGRREAIVVLVAVPTTLALTLFSSYLLGYTLNRVTLFALVFAIGILVDDAIVVVENVHRHLARGEADTRASTARAVDEVGNPTILATFAVVAALLPLAFVSGLMGPYMRPIPVNASAAMLFSLLVAFVVSPWLAHRLARRRAHVAAGAETGAGERSEGRLLAVYERLFRPLLSSATRRWALLAAVAALLAGSASLVALSFVKVKMLPYDDKSELQVVLDMPEGTTLESTANLARTLASAVRTLPEVTDVEVYAGTSAPFNFNGLVRHYFLRSGPLVADLQVNLLPKGRRSRSSHAIAKDVRRLVAPLALSGGGRVKVAEVPPGPPVLSTLVAEVYGPDLEQRVAIAEKVKDVFENTPGVVDVDWLVQARAPDLEFEIDPEKALRSGVSPDAVARTARVALAGAEAGLLHDEAAREPVPLVLRLERSQRSSADGLLDLAIPASNGRLVPLRELVRVRPTPRERFVYHKNLQPVTYVVADMAGAAEAPVYGILGMRRRVAALEGPDGAPLEILSTRLPSDSGRYAMKWDGEWHITYEVFRDMGVAFAAVLVLIYVLVVGWFRSFVTPLVIMAPIPLTLIGILPAHGLGGVFFTATSMIGFIALAGIIVRNSILLVDFVDLERKAGTSLEDAVVKAGAVRSRPIVLTALALVAGGLVILLDPIFQGLAVALISGVVVSTALTLVVIPLLYYMTLRTAPDAARTKEFS